jgi:epoxyqueuosine reductase QueG
LPVSRPIMPLVATAPDCFGADEFCKTCQVCTHACPPGAISEQKQLVRGVERWYVDFDKCIPYFAESASCGICIAECPWTRPNARPKLLATMARRLHRKVPEAYGDMSLVIRCGVSEPDRPMPPYELVKSWLPRRQSKP